MTDDLARRQANVARLRAVMAEIARNSEMAEASRSGREAPKPVESPQDTLGRFLAEVVNAPPQLSPETARRFHSPVDARQEDVA